ncbi:MAG: FAD-dependent monooxygenase [Gemmatimonadota bacterium]|nr:FAD-dependent monooxygenase [Gemmatimonadota bacterium]
MTAGPADVLIAGAGPAGSATAIHLARAGLRVVMVDRAAFPRDKACAEYMSPDTLRLLASLGVLPQLDGAGGHLLPGLRVTAPYGSDLLGLFARAGCAPFRPVGLSLPRRLLDTTLVDVARACGVDVRERAAVEELLYDEGAVAGAVIRSRSGRSALRARVTIGADGLRSRVARRMGGCRTGVPRRIAFSAHVRGVEGIGPGDPAEMHVGRRGYVGINPLGDGLANVAVVVSASRAREAAGNAAGFFLRELESYPDVRGRVPHDGIARRVLATGPFASRATRVTAAGALLVGDAADFFDPFTGEGIWSALRGAELAARTLVPALVAEPGILPAWRIAGYRAARRRAFAGKWLVERLIGYAMWSPRLFDRAVERLGRRPGMAHTLVGVTGRFVPARRVLDPRFLARMVF